LSFERHEFRSVFDPFRIVVDLPDDLKLYGVINVVVEQLTLQSLSFLDVADL
jgi:hypothetical protein